MDPKTIIVRGVNWLGDAVMSTPALQRLREKFTSSRIVLVTPEKLAELWKGHPAVDEVIAFAAGDSVFKTSGKLRGIRAGLGIAFPNSFRSAAELWLGRVPVRIGFAGGGRTLLLNKLAEPPPGKVKMHKRTEGEVRERVAAELPPTIYPATGHHIYNYLQLVTAAGADATPVVPRLYVDAGERERFRMQWQLAPDKVWIGINPGAEYGPAKRWPAQNFVEAAARVAREKQVGFIIFGGKRDVELATGIAEGIANRTGTTPVVASGKTSLRELCAGLSCCRIVLTNDTGPMHVAAALGVTVAVPFGSTSPELTGPGLPGSTDHLIFRSEVSCTPCFLRECPIDFRCMRSITAETVSAQVLQK